jgi:leucyl aminopeptidase
MVTAALLKPGSPGIPIEGMTKDGAAALPAPARDWVAAVGFTGAAGEVAIEPDGRGGIARAWFGLGQDENPLLPGKLPAALPPGVYRLAGGFKDPALATLAFALGTYRFSRYRKDERKPRQLVVPGGVDHAAVERIANAVTLARDLINTPANDMGPADLAAAVGDVALRYGASVTEVVGEALLKERLPLIHAVGAAAAPDRAPRLIDLTWGEPTAPKVTLVGKGVCFDTGGLDIKPSSNMLLMKKDMGGAANALALAWMIMDAGLPIRLRLLVPAVENAISSSAFRPGDIFASRKGITVEIGNTDAEGRLILADALAMAGEESPALLIDLATLTGAARVALGPEVVPFYATNDDLAADIARHAAAVADPMWRLPLWKPYAKIIESKVADINNAGTGTFAGSITAALFLARFVPEGVPWVHADIFGWNPTTEPARPEGGEAQAIRALYAFLGTRFAA